MGDELAGVFDEIGEQPELGRGQADLVAAEAGPMLVEIDDEVAVLEPARSIRVRRRSSSERGLDPRRELGKAQRLGDVVVRAELEPADLVRLRAPGRDHQDRDAAELADPLDDLPAVEPRQRDVEDHEVRVVLVEAAQRVGAGPCDDRPIAGAAHPQLDEVGELRFVLDDEDRVSHGPPRPASG